MALLKSLRLGDTRYNLSDYLRKSTGLVNNGNYGASGAKALDAAYGKTLNDTKYDKTGGDLSGGINILDPDFPDTAPAAAYYHHDVNWLDADGNDVAHATGIITPEDIRGMHIGTSRVVNGEHLFHTLMIGLDANGGRKVLLSRAAWEDALYSYYNAVNKSDIMCSGLLENNSKRLKFLIPYAKCHGSSIVLNNLKITASHVEGGYLYVRSGSGGGTYTQLGSSPVFVLANGAEYRSNEISSFSASLIQNVGIQIELNFAYDICTNTSGRVALNHTPVAIEATIEATIS